MSILSRVVHRSDVNHNVNCAECGTNLVLHFLESTLGDTDQCIRNIDHFLLVIHLSAQRCLCCRLRQATYTLSSELADERYGVVQVFRLNIREQCHKRL